MSDRRVPHRWKQLFARSAAWLDACPPGPAILAIGLLALTVRVGLVLALRYYGDIYSSEVLRIGNQLAMHGQFANPYACTTGLTAHSPPAFPFLVSWVFRAFPPGAARELGLCMLGCAVSGILYGSVVWLARQLRLRMSLAITAGFCGAAFPLFFWLESRGVCEANYVGLALCLLTGLQARVVYGGARTGSWVILGLLWGLAFLISPSLFPVFLGLLVVTLWYWRGVRKRAVVPLGIVLFCAGAVVLPWIIRNYRVFGQFFFIRDNFGLELATGNNAFAKPTREELLDSAGFREHPSGDLSECSKVAVLGEMAYGRMKRDAAIQWIRSHPGEFMRLTLARAWYFWFLALPSRAKSYVSAVIVLLAGAGLVYLFRADRRSAAVVAVGLSSYSLVYMVLLVDTRYRYPLHAILLLLACSAVWRGLERWAEAAPRTGGASVES